MTATADLMATLGLDKSGFSTGIKAAQGEAQELGQLASRIGGQLAGLFAVGSIASFISHQAAAAEATLNTSKALGISAESLQALTKTADLNASSEDAMTGALTKLQNKLGEAKNGSDAAIASFRALGITEKELAGMTLDTAVQRVADAWSAGAGDAQTYAAVQDVLGRGALELNATFNQIATQTLPKLTEQMKQSGKILADDVLRSLNTVDDVADRVTNKLSTRLANNVGVVLGGLMTLWGEEIDFGYNDPSQRQTTAEDRKQMASAEAKRKFSEMMRDTPADARQQAALDRLRAASDKLAQDEIKRMSALEREVDLVGRIAEIWRNSENVSPEDAPAQAEELLRLNSELATVRLAVAKQEEESARKRADHEAKIAEYRTSTQARIASLFAASTDPAAQRPVSELNRIGGFVGGQRDVQREYQAGILRANEQAVRLLQDMARQIAELNRKTKSGPVQV